MNTNTSRRTVQPAIYGVLGAVIGVAATLIFGARFIGAPARPDTAAGEEILVMRTKGGMLEVSSIQATESFSRTTQHDIFGFNVGQTVTHIRVPATYRYRIALAPEWRVLRSGTTFTVVAPRVQPSLPVAVDLSRMAKFADGQWTLFTEQSELDALERSITAALAKKAELPAYLTLQRDAARQTVGEFVRKWLLTQQQWADVTNPQLRVLFQDEPIGSVDAFVNPARLTP